MKRRNHDSGLRLKLARAAGAPLVRLWGGSIRWRRMGEENLRAARELSPGGVIFAFWHGRMLPLLFAHRGLNVHVLVSRHRDGEVIAEVASRCGFSLIRGSTSRGGREAFFALGELGRGGADLALTPDGPRGPGGSAYPGVVALAQRTGLPIIPSSAGGKGNWCLGTWDRFCIPRPGGECRVVYAPPVVVPRRAGKRELEELRGELEQTLHEITAAADGGPIRPGKVSDLGSHARGMVNAPGCGGERHAGSL